MTKKIRSKTATVASGQSNAPGLESIEPPDVEAASITPAPKTEQTHSSPLPPLTPSNSPMLIEHGVHLDLNQSIHRDYTRPIEAGQSLADEIARAEAAAGPEQPIESLREFVEETHLRYDSLDNELHRALETQERISLQQEEVARKIEKIRQQARASRLVFSHNISNAREVLAAEARTPLSTDSEGEIAPAPSISPSPAAPRNPDVPRYLGETTPMSSLTKYALFRPRSPSEDDDTYKRRVGEQRHLLAREHYADSIRERNARAAQIWQRLETAHSQPTNPLHGLVDLPKAESILGRDSLPKRTNIESTNSDPLESDFSHPLRSTRQEPPRMTGPAYLRAGEIFEGPLGLDTTLPNGEYTRKQLALIRTAIVERVGREPSSLATVKNLKSIPSPDKYGGEDNDELFMGWMKSFLRWLALGRITGEALDADRVQLLGQYLIQEARLWYDDAIDNLDGVGRHWTFEQCISALYRRFIHRSTARAAAEKFARVKYRRETGVSGLWDNLLTLARKMPEPPDDYSFKVRLLEALPEEICDPMLRHRNVSLERSSSWELRTAAIIQEENNRVLDDWRASHRATHQRDADRTPRMGDRVPRSSRPGIIPRVATHPSALPSTARQTAGENSRGVRAAAIDRSDPRPAGGIIPVTNTRPVTRTPGTPSQGIQCYNCRAFGHISANCPRAQTPRLRAVRILEATDSASEPTEELPGYFPAVGPAEPTRETTALEESPGPEPEGADLPEADALYDSDDQFFDAGGSQYDPDEEQAAAYSDHDNEAVWFGSLRIVSDDEEPNPDRWIILRDDFVGPSPLPASILSLAEELQRQHLTPGDFIPTVTVDPTVEDYSDLPDLEPAAHFVLPEAEDWMPAPDGYRGPQSELPFGSELDDAWRRFIDSDRSNDDISEILTLLYRLTHQNEHLLRELYDNRTRIDALSEALAWTRRELAIALFREGEGLTSASDVHDSSLSGQRTRVRNRVLTETSPFTEDIDDEVDDPRPVATLPEANDLLLRVVEGTDVSEATELMPPDYERVCRIQFFAITVSPSADPLVTQARAGRRPLLSDGEQECIALLLKINGLQALTLCDAGSTTEMISNDFARVSTCDIIKLENPAILQLGCAGSRSRINFGTRAPVMLGTFCAEVYFDVANLDRYDAVLGTPFLRRFGVMLDFKSNCIHLDGKVYPALSRAQVTDVLRKRGGGPRARERPLASTGLPTPSPQPSA